MQRVIPGTRFLGVQTKPFLVLGTLLYLGMSATRLLNFCTWIVWQVSDGATLYGLEFLGHRMADTRKPSTQTCKHKMQTVPMPHIHECTSMAGIVRAPAQALPSTGRQPLMVPRIATSSQRKHKLWTVLRGRLAVAALHGYPCPQHCCSAATLGWACAVPGCP